mmetsp:Transcript_78125/g.197241  ORF Transcript_78125/g.197241 Transcript_78125/m.197241 type:complete len:285 (+) Transcript_78125:133-987(+)
MRQDLRTSKCSNCGTHAPSTVTKCPNCRSPMPRLPQTRASWADLSDASVAEAGESAWGHSGVKATFVRTELPVDGVKQDNSQDEQSQVALSDVPGHWLPSLSSSSRSGDGLRSQPDRSPTARDERRGCSVSPRHGSAGNSDSEANNLVGAPTTRAVPLDLLAKVPTNQNGEMTSVGSIGHSEGKCNPCAYWFKGVCAHGVTCRHCHFMHEGQRGKRLRPSKLTRQRLKNKGSGQEGSAPEDGDVTEPGQGSRGDAAMATAAATVGVQCKIAEARVGQPRIIESL